jgi:hypothetical protein
MKRSTLVLSFIIMASLGIVFFSGWVNTSPVQAQSESYRLNVQRSFGFSGSGMIRGTFKSSVIGPLENIQSVTYLIDGQPMSEVMQSPFSLSWRTGDYPLGPHELSAAIKTKDGRTVTTDVRQVKFASPEDESAATQRIIFPMLGGVLALILIIIGAQVLLMRNKPGVKLPLGAERKYGLSGGTICPRCQRPYALHWWAINVGLGSKFDRCDFCGKWARVRPLSRAKLEAAERAELADAQPETPVNGKTEEEKLKEMLDNSRFTD